MANLITPRSATIKYDVDSVLPQLLQPLIAAGVVIYEGALVTSDALGFARPGGTGVAIGRAIQTVDNRVPPTSGPLPTILVEPGCFSWDTATGVDAVTLATTLRGDTVFIVDDHTVARTDGGGARAPAGYFVDVNPLGGVFVQTGLAGLTGTPQESGSEAAAVIAQAAWFIDPANLTGLASNSNSGLTSATPLLDEGELARRRRVAAQASDYGGSFPVTQDTVVTYLSEPPDPLTHPILLDVIRLGSANLSYVFAPTVVKSSTIASIPTTRGGATWWEATSTAGFVSGDVGSIVYDTTAGTCAFVMGVTGGVADMSEWLTTRSTPAITLTNAAVPLLAPSVTDAYSVMHLARVKVAALRIRQGAAPNGAFGHWAVSFFGFRFAADMAHGFGLPDAMMIMADSASFGITLIGACFTQCAFEGVVNHVRASSGYVNCYAPNQGSVAFGRLAIIGGLVSSVVSNGSVVVLDGYAALAGAAGVVDQQCPAKSLFFAGSVTLYKVHDAFIVEQGSQVRLQTGFYGAGSERFAGATNAAGVIFEMSNGAVVRKLTGQTWTTVLGAASYTTLANLDGQTNALPFTPATLTFGPATAVNVANLDNALSLNGNAVNPGTGTALRNT